MFIPMFFRECKIRRNKDYTAYFKCHLNVQVFAVKLSHKPHASTGHWFRACVHCTVEIENILTRTLIVDTFKPSSILNS